MNLFRSIGRAMIRGGARLATTGQWEGHRSTRRFEDLPRRLGSQDDTTETTQDREDMISTARVMCQLFGLGNRILRTYANYVVGPCDVSWNTDDEKWNDQAIELWNAKAQLIDARGREDFAGMARLTLIHTIRDGDVGFAKILRPGYPMLEPIEADRIGPSALSLGRADLVGGVKLDAYQRPIEFWIADRMPMGGFRNLRPVTAANFLHVYDTMRFDAVRGVSAFAYGALGRSRSLRGLIRAEEVGVETAAKWAVLLKQINPNANFDGNVNLTDDAEDVATDTTKYPKTEEIYDGMIQRIGIGEDVTTVQSNRPSQAWQGFVDFLIQDFAISLDLPKEFVWSMAGATGPGVRMASKQAERTFRQAWRMLERRFMRPVISWVIADAMETGQLPFNPQFYDFSIQRPDHPTIDAGRESAANINEYEQALMSGKEICGERGRNIYDVQREKAREIRNLMDLAEEFKIPFETLYGKVKTAIAPPPAQPAQSDEEETDTPPGIPKRQPADGN